MSDTTTGTAAKAHDAAKVEEKRRHPEPAQGGLGAGDMLLLDTLLGASVGDPRLDRHAAILSDPRFSHSANSVRKAEMVSGLQGRYGNAYVQRLLGSPDPRRDEHRSEVGRVLGTVSEANSMMDGTSLEKGKELPRVEGHDTEIEVNQYVGERISPQRDCGKPRAGLHADAEADGLSRQLGAKAFTTGQDVFIGEERYQPISQDSGGLISHGQAHVVQQAATLSRAPKGKKATGSQATPWTRPVSSWKEVAEKDQISLPDLLSLAKSSLRLAILIDCVSEVATLSGEPWKPSAKAGTTWKEMPAGSGKDEHYRETDMDRRKKVVDAIANCRSMIKELNASDVGGQAALLRRVQAFFYGLLNSASPYYTQMANISLLGKGAWEWTCNVTSLAMTLEALGVTAGDFKGDLGLLSAIAQCLHPERFKTVADVTSLRMPDLLQLVVIYNQDTGKLLGEHQRGGQGSSPSKRFAGLVTEVRKAARPRVSSTLDVFVEVAQQFKGVSVNYSGAGSAGTKELTASAKRTKAVKRLLKTKRRIAQIESQLAKLERQSHGGQARTASKLTEELEKRNSEREELEGSIGKLSASLPAAKSADNVKNYGLWAISTLRPLLDQGKQLVVNRPGHYVRLESVGADGVLIDDPAFLGKQILLGWEEAYQEGFLRSWVVVSK